MSAFESLVPIGGEVTMGGLLGFVTGYAAKKIAKLVAVLVGLQVAVFTYLETRGVLEVNWSKLSGSTPEVGQIHAQASGYLADLASAVPLGGGFTVGAVAGFKRA